MILLAVPDRPELDFNEHQECQTVAKEARFGSGSEGKDQMKFRKHLQPTVEVPGYVWWLSGTLSRAADVNETCYR
ncbi:hypothetical protein BDV28DRAFT_149193 [Aspergillus coremiiformis]|uniref:Uncharacterized protein n=1 Tax=Aspergillus coremiiformis TaxID=138285 RepID=A0A5N6Z3M0_9EURO|nr:hypothetical protein BDV28DRAFT_149193 [Aspergillus coremiiformis]